MPCPKWLIVIWDVLNKPLIVALILVVFGYSFLLMFGEKEKVRCDIMIHPDVNYLRNVLNHTDDTIGLFMRLYSKPFVANLTFDNYQEAISYKYLWVDGQDHKAWYKPTLDCDPAKIGLPLEPKDLVKK